MRASEGGRHISGAETIVPVERLYTTAGEFLRRALSHPRGQADEVYLTVERLKGAPLYLKTLPVCTVNIRNTHEAWHFIEQILSNLGISEEAFKRAKEVIRGGGMRGAALITLSSGRRMERDTRRGVRATRMGIIPEAEERLHQLLISAGMHPTVVKEALILATKVSSCPYVVAELCVSDDPDYTTGYIASRRLGYLRIPFIKEGGVPEGGRVFFVEEDPDIEGIYRYLEGTPVMIEDLGDFMGEVSPGDVLRSTG